jgi:serine protease Do
MNQNSHYFIQGPDDSWQYVYPHGSYGGQGPSGSPRPPRRGHSRTVILVVVILLAVALFATITGAIVFSALKSPLLEGRLALPTAPLTTETTSGSSGKEQKPAVGMTDKNFSIDTITADRRNHGPVLSTVQIARIGKPAVVAINTEIVVSSPFGDTGLVPAAGSGFIITDNGYIVTNHHVIAGARTMSVVLDSGESYVASLVGSDSANDLAVLKIDGKNLPVVKLGYSADLQVGELAVAIGNPLGKLSGTVTAGIISALDRKVVIDGQPLYLLQTDAAINAGNSGGALFNSYGEVIGINTAKNTGAGVEGLGFAIPIDHAKPIIETIIRNGPPPGRPKIGLYTQDIDEATAKQYGLPVGVYIARVDPDSPADRAGLQKGDVIIAVDGQEARTTEAVNAIKNQHAPGDVIKLTIVRDGREQVVQVTLGEENG